MNNIVPLRRVSLPLSETSVTGPYRPQPKRQQWTNSDVSMPTLPANVSRIREANVVPPSVVPPLAPKKPATPPPAEKHPLSIGKRIAALAGVLCCSIGVVGGFVLIVALGPIGIGIAAGAAIVGAVLIKIGTQK